MDWHTLKPLEIERRSFEIIDRELGERRLDPERADIVKRVIHTTADLEFADLLYFSEGAVEAGKAAMLAGASIVTDTKMAAAGISKAAIERLGGSVLCFMSDEDVAEEAARRGTTRAAVSMEKACSLAGPLVFAIGNAPTALLRLDELISEGRVIPSLVIAAPVGFVNVVESKDAIMRSGVPCIVSRGRKGGSAVAAAICNALLYQVAGRAQQQ